MSLTAVDRCVHQSFRQHNGRKTQIFVPLRFLTNLKAKLIGQHNGLKTPIHEILYKHPYFSQIFSKKATISLFMKSSRNNNIILGFSI
jgi:hypothetical protein